MKPLKPGKKYTNAQLAARHEQRRKSRAGVEAVATAQANRMKTNVSLAQPSDADQASEWLLSTDNDLDSGVLEHPSLRTLKVEVEGSPILYAPFHPVLCVESLGHRPGTRLREDVFALSGLQDSLENIAQTYGMREIYWMSSDRKLTELAQARGYEVVKCAVLRKKIP